MFQRQSVSLIFFRWLVMLIAVTRITAKRSLGSGTVSNTRPRSGAVAVTVLRLAASTSTDSTLTKGLREGQLQLDTCSGSRGCPLVSCRQSCLEGRTQVARRLHPLKGRSIPSCICADQHHMIRVQQLGSRCLHSKPRKLLPIPCIDG